MIKHSVFLFLCLALAFSSQAQVTNSSPYSRYALGDINPIWYAQNTALGGSTVALIDSFQVNVLNPASYSFTAKHYPVFDVGVKGRMVDITTSDATASTNYISLSNISLVMPFTKKWGTSFGLLPYSNSGYSVKVSETNSSLGGTTTSTYVGEGGIYRIYLGTAYALVKSPARTLSVGGNASYMFGNIEKTRVMYLPFTSGMYNSKVINSSYAKDLMFDLGLAYRERVNARQSFTFGASATIGKDVNMTRSILAHTIDPSFGSFVDTVKYVEEEKGTVFIPSRYNLGFTYDFKGIEGSKRYYKLSLTGQYTMQDWTKYNEDFASTTFNDTLRRTSMFNFGVQYIPHMLGVGTGKISPIRLVNYRLGGYYSKNYLLLRGENINNWGLTAGIGIPLIHSVSYSMLNISFEYGSRGTTANNLLKETYTGIHVGIAVCPGRFADRWFVKRKYD